MTPALGARNTASAPNTHTTHYPPPRINEHAAIEERISAAQWVLFIITRTTCATYSLRLSAVAWLCQWYY